MDLLIVMTYAVCAWGVFKIFKIPVNQWTLSTTVLGGGVLVSGLVLIMNYNHPYSSLAQKAIISIPVTPAVSGMVIEVTDRQNKLIKKGEVLFKLDPSRYQARVKRLQADVVTATHNIEVLKAQLSEAEARTASVSAERDRLYKDYKRYLVGSRSKVNPFSESDIDKAKQNYLAQNAHVKSTIAKQIQIQSQLDSVINGDQSQIASLKAQLAEAQYDLEQTVVRAPSDGYATQVLVRPGTYAVSLPLRPVMVFIPEQERRIVAQFRQNSLLRLKPGDEAEVVFNALPGKVFRGRLLTIFPVVPGGTYQAMGVVQSLTMSPGADSMLGLIELDSNVDIAALPDGVYSQVAVYSDHVTHVAVMRKVLLRMTSWMHYLYLDH